MPRKKANIKDILAANLKHNRRKKGLTQEKLAEMADISLRYLAMLELGNSFPSGDVLEKLSEALGIQAFQLFYPSLTPEGAMFHLEQSIIANIEKAVSTVLKQSDKNPSIKKELEQLRQDLILDIKNICDDKFEKSIVFNIEDVVKMSVKQAVATEFKNLKTNK
jgi:transcriptional regulator with XRE-family HTH domain